MRIWLFSLLILFKGAHICAHPIIISLAHPRSLSTVFERIIHERGDFHVIDEPIMYLYYFEHHPSEYETDDLPKTTSELKKYILELAETKPVFIKDHAFALEYLEMDPQFQFMIQKRHPIKSLPSFYKMQREVDWDRIGYEALYQAKQTLPITFTLDADDLEENPEKAYADFCNAFGLSCNLNNLEFKKAPPEDWWEWDQYKNARSLPRIEKSKKNYPVDENGLPLFEEIDPEDRPLWLEYYKRALEFYSKL